jgi:hypothetical protein
MKRLFSHEDGIKTFLETEKEGNKRTWNWSYEFDDVSANVDYSRGLQKEPDHWKEGVKKDMVHYAHIPPSILLKWHFEGVNINNPRALINRVNQREWSYLKCVDKVITAKE